MKHAASLISDLLPVATRCCRGSFGVALGGSRAKGCDDAHSDLDLYIFADAVLPTRAREALLDSALHDPTDITSWGGDEPFVQCGTDFRVATTRIEWWFRSIDYVSARVDQCGRGELRREYAGWTVMGFSNHVLLSDLHSMRILSDPFGVLAAWQAAAREYPEPLRRAILERFMSEARFWPENPHYESAVRRADLLYVSGIVQQVLHALIQVVFALNRVYFPGEKKLTSALAALPIRPDEFEARLEKLCVPEREPERLWVQRRSLCELVREVERLVRLYGVAA